MSASFYFYDLETSGLNPRGDRVMQFAGQRTDPELNPLGDPDNFLISLADDTLPSPAAILVTGITPQATRADGLSEPEFCRFVTEQLRRQKYNRLHIVIGVVSDKKIDKILPLLPKDATYYFTKAQIPRALDENTLMAQAAEYGLRGNSYPTVAQAFNAAKENAAPDDFIFIGGSNFTVAEIL